MKNNMNISGKYPDETVENDANFWVLAPLTALGILLLAVSGYGLASSLGIL